MELLRRSSLSPLLRSFLTMGVLVTLVGVGLQPVSAATTGPAITEYPIPPPTNSNAIGSYPYDITRGPDGNVWFADLNGNFIGKVTQSGSISEFPVPSGNGYPRYITAGPDGALWFTEENGWIGRITPGGAITEFSVPNTQPAGIATGPDGNLWFVEQATNLVASMTPSGAITEYAIPTHYSFPTGIAVGGDGALWFTEDAGNAIGRVTTDGVVTEYPLPTSGSRPFWITAGPDGNVWFTEIGSNKVGRMSPSGSLSEFPVPDGLDGITSGPDGLVWFTTPHKVGRMATSGAFTEYATADPNTQALGITTGADGNIWFTDTNDLGTKIGRVALDATPPTTTASVSGSVGANGWYKAGSAVQVALSAADNPGGSGVLSITYAATGANPIGQKVATNGDGASPFVVAVPIARDGVTTISYYATDAAGNQEQPHALTVKLDATPPTLACSAKPSSIWPPNHKPVSVTTAIKMSDGVSGPAGFTLTGEQASGSPSDIQGFTVGEPSTAGGLAANKGEVYTLTYQGADQAGNTALCVVTVNVQLDQGKS